MLVASQYYWHGSFVVRDFVWFTTINAKMFRSEQRCHAYETLVHLRMEFWKNFTGDSNFENAQSYHNNRNYFLGHVSLAVLFQLTGIQYDNDTQQTWSHMHKYTCKPLCRP